MPYVIIFRSVFVERRKRTGKKEKMKESHEDEETEKSFSSNFTNIFTDFCGESEARWVS